MTFLHVSLLLGTIVVSAPILMHLLGRRQPKPITFPAIRFVRETAVSAQRGWSIKRWLLLALRILAVMILAFALASPRVPSGQYANVLAGGLLATLGLVAGGAALTAYGGRKSKWVVGAASGLFAFLMIASGVFLWSAFQKSEAISIGSSDGPVCAAIIIDTSPSMAYRYHNASRLDEAKEMTRWLMDRFPVPSQIAIIGSDSGARLNPDRRSAERQLDRITVEGKATNLVDRIRSAVELVRKSELERREIYVVSDMRDAAWREGANSELAALLSGKATDGTPTPKVLLQLIDVGVPDTEIKNWALSNAKLSRESSTPGGNVTVSVDVMGTDATQDEQVMCELVVEPIDLKLPAVRQGEVVLPEGRVVDRQLVQVPAGGSVPLKMTLSDLADGTNHAVLRLSRPDPLELDNSVYLTVEARTQGQTVVFSEDPRDGQLVSLIIQPERTPEAQPGARTGAGQASADPQDENVRVVSPGPVVEPYSRLGNLDLSRYANIVLFDPRSISADDADRLTAWVQGGGGLLVLMGPSAGSAESIASNGLATLMPGVIKRQTRRSLEDRTMLLNPLIENHPIWSTFERPIKEIPWVQYPIFRHWDLEGLANDASEIAKVTGSDMPAIVEWIRGQGRILVMTLPYPEPSATASTEPWSELFTTSADAWPGYALFVGMVGYMATHNKHPVNYFVDSVALLDNNTSQYPKVYELFNPSNEVVRTESVDEMVSFPFTRQPGQYRLRGLRPRGPIVRGFSVNINRDEISLKRVGESALHEMLGRDNYGIAREKSEVQSSIGEGRYGRDLSPFLMVILVLVVIAEQTMASRFYSSTRSKS